MPRVLKALYEISMTSNCPFKLTSERASRRDNMKKKKWTSEENKLASMLAWVCCHADEDCPSEYRTKHFREHLKEAVDYLENSGWYDYNQQAGSK